jgi:DNA-binding FadR family transcriptional regulator
MIERTAPQSPKNKGPMFKTAISLRRNVHSQVADQIGLSIMQGDIAPGDALPSEMRICEMLDVSRTVVREAIRMLTGKGLVESRAKSGTRVRPPEDWNHLDPDVLRWQLQTTDVDTYLAKLFQLRNAVEPAATAMAASASTVEDRQRLRAAFEGMAAAKTNDAFVASDIAFHKGIYFATRNEFFWPIAQMFEITLSPSLTIAATGDHRPRSLVEHRDVVEAIERRDPEQARQAAVLLLRHSAADLVRIRGIDPFGSTDMQS